jgi:hypothetical protein
MSKIEKKAKAAIARQTSPKSMYMNRKQEIVSREAAKNAKGAKEGSPKTEAQSPKLDDFPGWVRDFMRKWLISRIWERDFFSQRTVLLDWQQARRKWRPQVVAHRHHQVQGPRSKAPEDWRTPRRCHETATFPSLLCKWLISRISECGRRSLHPLPRRARCGMSLGVWAAWGRLRPLLGNGRRSKKWPRNDTENTKQTRESAALSRAQPRVGKRRAYAKN